MVSTGLITILFTDLVGSTEMASSVGDVAADAMRRDHFASLREAVAATGGTEVKTIGDALMVSYASAADALTGAATMQRAVGRHNRKLDGHALAMRIGVSAGDATFEDGDWFGTPVVESARLCAAATGDQILLSDLVRALAGSRVDLEIRSVGTLELKGLPEPLASCELLWQAETVSAGVPLPAFVEIDPAFPFAGRIESRELVVTAWKEAIEGDRRTVLVSGEPGIGKTRLVTEVVRYAHDHGSVVLWGRCDEEGGAPFGPFAEALRHYIASVPPDRLQSELGSLGGELVRIIPDLPGAVPGLAAPLTGDADSERFRLFDSVVDLLAEMSVADPVVLVLDDLHWADKPSLLLMRHILRSSTPMRLLLLATYRDTDLDRTHPLSDVLADLRREQGVQRVDLQGLDVGEIVRLLSSSAGHELDESGLELAQTLRNETQGNPFFVGEVVRHLVESGAIVQDGDRWVPGPGADDYPIPEGIREVVGRRLSNLSDDLNKALTIAAVIGPVFDFSVIEGAGGPQGDALFDALDEATRHRLIRDVPGSPGKYTFSHALVRSSLYEELTTIRRVRMHWRIGEVLEQRYGRKVDEHLDELAFHFVEGALAGDPSKAVEYSRRAGEKALADLAFEAAATHFERALGTIELDDDGNPTERLDLLLARARALEASGDIACQPVTFEAGELARVLGDADRLVQASLVLVERNPNTDGNTINDDLVRLLEDALEVLPPGPSLPRVKVQLSLAVHLHWGPELDRRIRLAVEARDMARSLDDPAALAFAVPRYWAWLDGATPWVNDFDEILEEGRVASEASGDRDAQKTIELFRFSLALALGDRQLATARLAEYERMVGRQRDPAGERLVLSSEASLAQFEGRVADSERLTMEYYERSVVDHLAEHQYMPIVGSLLYTTRAAQGRLDELVPTIETMVAESPGAPVWRIALGGALIESGQVEPSRPHFEWLADDECANVPADVEFAVTVNGLARMSWALEVDAAVVRPIYEMVLPFSGTFNWTGATISDNNDMGLALAAACLGWDDVADQHFADAITLNERAGARAFLGRTHFDWGRVLARRGDHDGAREQLERAIEIGGETGADGRWSIVTLGQELLEGLRPS